MPVGGDAPLVVQSMTTTFTHDVPATLAQIEALAAAGCQVVRVTVPALRDAEALPAIRAGMAARGLTLPLVADVHFSPKLALLAVEHVDKVRINPGNFAERPGRAAPPAEGEGDLERVARRLEPLVVRARERGVALRIGTNHGSLSERIVRRHGDTPQGMVESALEYVRVCRQLDFHDLVLSMKASSTLVCVQAYRLLAARMEAEGMDYPFHLGVTEAGSAEAGRIKSAIGIGSLLDDGIGDTLRVSLTEDPAAEVPVGFALARRAEARWAAARERAPEAPPREAIDPYRFARRETRAVTLGALAAGGEAPPRVHATWQPGAPEADAADRPLEGLLVAAGGDVAAARAWEVPLLVAAEATLAPGGPADAVRLTTGDPAPRDLAGRCALLEASASEGDPAAVARALAARARAALAAGASGALVAVVPDGERSPVGHVRALAATLDGAGLDLPLALVARGDGPDGLLRAAADLGALLLDGLGDAVRIDGVPPAVARAWGHGILQGARRRTTAPEFISCPGCGRTLFDLAPVTAAIQGRTGHLVGVKIAVMGCIVNGPGEMADADFGYVGWKPGRVNLFVGRECVAEGVPEAEAPDRLVALIQERGRWVDPP